MHLETLPAPTPHPRSPAHPSPHEPAIGPLPQTTSLLLNNTPVSLIIDNGSQLDILDPSTVKRVGAPLLRLANPIRVQLGLAKGQDSITQWTHITTSDGVKSFFVAPLPFGTAGILGTPSIDSRLPLTICSRSQLCHRQEAQAPPPASERLPEGEARFENQNHHLGRDKSENDPAPYDAAIPIEDNDTTYAALNNYPHDLGRLSNAELLDLGATTDPLDADTQHALLSLFKVIDIATDAIALDTPARDPTAVLGALLTDDDIIPADAAPFVPPPDGPEPDDDAFKASYKSLLEEYGDVIVTGGPPQLPPRRVVDHRIRLRDPNAKIRPRLYSVPARYRQQLIDHIQLYVDRGIWFPAILDSASPMFAVPKSDPAKGRFVVDLRERNANTVRTSSTIPDISRVRNWVASFPHRTRFDLKVAYEQVRVHPDDVHLTGFKTSTGTFLSRVMQMGDCNAQDTLNTLMATIFRQATGRFVEVYFDDLFVASPSRRLHLAHLRYVLDVLRRQKIYLSADKVQVCPERMDALGSIITSVGCEVDPVKLQQLRSFPAPTNSS